MELYKVKQPSLRASVQNKALDRRGVNKNAATSTPQDVLNASTDSHSDIRHIREPTL
uniref:Uncharacterized protein n=1 Tax=Arundo donax TaxID=35708 RepID=A0A0A9FAQ6_ARUDO